MQKKAEKVSAEIAKIEAKYNCKLGVWLTWRDMMRNLDTMRDNIGMDIAQFGVQIQFNHGEKSGD
jgi:hypothetical protein